MPICLADKGLYLLGEGMVVGAEGRFIWFGPFTQQAAYTTGREPLWYIYSKRYETRDADI